MEALIMDRNVNGCSKSRKKVMKTRETVEALSNLRQSDAINALKTSKCLCKMDSILCKQDLIRNA